MLSEDDDPHRNSFGPSTMHGNPPPHPFKFPADSELHEINQASLGGLRSKYKRSRREQQTVREGAADIRKIMNKFLIPPSQAINGGFSNDMDNLNDQIEAAVRRSRSVANRKSRITNPSLTESKFKDDPQ